MLNTRHTTSYIMLFFSSLFWGASFVFTKSLLNDFSPITINFVRILIASLFLLTFSLLFLRGKMRIEKRDMIIVCAFSFFEPFLYFIFETASLQHCSASVVSIIIATIPVFTALLSKYYFKELFTKFNMLGVVVSVVGIGIMLLPGFSDGLFSLIGILLAFGAVLAAVGYGFFLRKLSKNYHPVVLITWQNLVTALLFLPLFLIAGFKNGFPSIETFTTPESLVSFLILSIFCSSLAFIFLVQGVQVLGLGKSMIFTNLIPVITAIVSFFLLNEEFPIYKIAGIIVVIAGIFMVQKPKK